MYINRSGPVAFCFHLSKMLFRTAVLGTGRHSDKRAGGRKDGLTVERLSVFDLVPVGTADDWLNTLAQLCRWARLWRAPLRGMR